MSDDEDVPPLEDMSGLLDQIENIKSHQASSTKTQPTSSTKTQPTSSTKTQPTSSTRSQESNNSCTSPTVSSNAASTKQSPSKPVIEAKKPADKPQTFGGMKKGFLFGGSSKPTTRSVAKPTISTTEKSQSSSGGDIPLIKPKDPDAKEKQYEIPEVQQAMNASKSFLQNKDWVTEDLLSKVQSNEALLRGMSNPQFMQAIAEFQTNPQAAMAKYQANPEIRKFLTDFCGIMGDHFSSMGGDEPAPQAQPSRAAGQIITPSVASQGADLSVHSSSDPNQMTGEDERKMEQLLSDPDIRQILMDPQIQKLMHSLRNDPEHAQRLLHQSDKQLQKKIQKLVNVGLLQFQR